MEQLQTVAPPATTDPPEPETDTPTLIMAVTADGDIRPMEEVEAELIRLALRHYRGRMATVARKLRIGRSTLYRRIKELGIAEADDDASLATE